jgi:geranylgeranyl diphosphate synthase, type I
MQSFEAQIDIHRRLINDDIAAYAVHARQSATEQYGPDGVLIIDAFLDMLERGGKRMRGSLVLTGYQMCGGQNMQMIVRAATAIEIVQSSLLILDDIQDRSDLRRAKPTVHKLLQSYHQEKKLHGDAEHTGMSLALNAMMAGEHAALMLIGGLDADAELRTKVHGIIDQTFVVTAHGQTVDILNECRDDVTEAAIDNVMEWKTAYYSVLNPLCVGMVLAGAGCEDTDAIRDYAIHTGKAFQITDDILGIFGEEAKTGKSPMSDIQEGKKTLLTLYALANATPQDAAFLRQNLGNPTITQADFSRCQHIIEISGAKKYAKDRAEVHVQAALRSLRSTPAGWQTEQITFLRDLVSGLTDRSR